MVDVDAAQAPFSDSFVDSTRAQLRTFMGAQKMTDMSNYKRSAGTRGVCTECSATVGISARGLAHHHRYRRRPRAARCAGGGLPVQGPGIEGRATAVFSLQYNPELSGVLLAQMAARRDRAELTITTGDPRTADAEAASLLPEQVRAMADWLDAASQRMREVVVPAAAVATADGRRPERPGASWSRIVPSAQAEFCSMPRQRVLVQVVAHGAPLIAVVAAVTRRGAQRGVFAYLTLDQVRDLREDLRR